MMTLYLLVILLYIVLLYAFSGYIRIIEVLELLFCVMLQTVKETDVSFDYIVVGCGSSGAVVAQRLAQDTKLTVLVLDAGFYGTNWFDIPALGPLFQHSSIDWKYTTESQSNAAKGYANQMINWPMGRIIGGSGRINNMIYIRGHPNDFNEWYHDVPDYNYEWDILRYFKKAENQKGMFINNTKHHGTKGPLIVEDPSFVSPFANVFLNAAEILGYPVRDLNGAYSTGFMQTQLNTNGGRRWTPAHTLLSHNLPNVLIHTNSLVHKVLLRDNYEAYGVKFSYLGKTKIIHASKAIILCAGAIGTPKILMLSGIGPKEHLNNVGIETKLELPVGNNLQDHVTTGSDLVLLNTTMGITPFTMLSLKSMFEYFYYGTGSWTSGGCEVVGVIDTCNSNYNSSDQINSTLPEVNKLPPKECFISRYQKPDLQFMILPLGASTDGGIHLRKVANFDDETWKKYFVPLIDKNVVTILPVVLHPKSRGTVRLLNSSPYSKPVINPNYLSHPYDVETLLKGIAFIKDIIKTSPMQKLGATLNTGKFPGCEGFDFDTNLYWECYVRHFSITAFHPAGTCKMGKSNEKDAVVDHSFAVHKTNKLYVVDASIMPSLTSGNINAAVVMLAEKASDLVKWHNYLITGFCNQIEIFLPKLIC